MKRLLIAIAAAATTLFAPAAIKTQLGFEGSDGTPYDSTVVAPSTSTNYPFADFGSKYLELDEEYDVASVFAQGDPRVFDMYVQFTAMTETPELPTEAKIAVYAGSDGSLYALSDADGTVSLGTVKLGDWVRLTIVSVTEGYDIYVDGNGVGSVAADENATTVEFTGSGKLDNFVARTTDPFYAGSYAASVGTGADNEKYATYSDALADVLSSGATQAITIADETPRTVDGTAANPYEITNLADLKAFQEAIAATNGIDKCYALTADIALNAAWPGIGIQNGKDIYSTADFDAAAFCGTFDGKNHTISGFQMIGKGDNAEGLDYCGFFNSTYGATIKNLKIQYAGALFAADTTASTKESGATFVGVAKNSTLQNLTSLQKDSETPVSCSKGFGGIVGYTTSGTTVDSCTNNVNMTSLANNKCGGIAMITQGGSAVTIRNCQNNGTTAGKATEKGGIVGYVSVATTIDGCSDTAGSTPSILHNQGQTVTISGVITAPTNVVAYTTSNNNPIDGLDFATVDANGIATFVKAADLAAGNTYKVMGPKAAYAFTQAGTLALDQSLATATVTADTSTLVLSDETVENVTTYTAVAGVASVNNVAYATFDEAVEAIGETGDDFVTLLADVTTDLNAGTTLKVRTNAHELTFNKADDVLVTPTVDSSTGITTYTSVEGMAKCNNTWYATFNEAYSAALSSSGNATMEVKLTSDFTPDISATYDHFYSLKFTDVRDDKTEGLTINLKNAAGTAYMKSSRYSFPENATLNLAADYDCWTNNLISGGTLNIPEGVTVSIGAYLALNNLTSIIGEGRIKPSAAACYYLLWYSDDKLPTSLRETTWKGTLEISGTYTDNFNLNNYGNSDSTIAFNAYTGYVHSVSRIADVGSIEVLGGGLTVNGDYPSGTYTFPNTVKGSGPLTVHVVDTASGTTQKTVKFTGDVSAFAGDLKIVEGSNCRVAFGSEGLAGNGSCIVVCSDAEVSVAEGKTWDSQNGFVVLGTMNVFGTLKHKGGSANDKIYGSATTGKIVYKNAAAITTFGGSYKGEIVIDSIEAGTTLTQVALAFGCEGAKLTLNGVSGNAWCADADYTVKPEVTLAGNVHFQNGSSGKTVTFRKIAAGTGNLSLRDWNGCTGITYGFTTLDADNYTGTVVLYGSKLTFKVGNILKTGAVAGDKVLPLTVESNATVDLSNATLNGETADLELKADGIYVAVPAVPKVAEVVGGEQYETLAEAIAAATDGATVKLLADVDLTSTVTIAKDVTLDLNEYNVASLNCRAFLVTAGTVAITGSGTVSATADENVNTSTFPTSSSVIRVGSNTAATSFTLGADVTVSSDYCYGITYFGTKKQTVVINGTVAVTGEQAAISGNGHANYNTAAGGSDVTVNGTVSASQDYAIYNPQTGTTVINGTVTGGIEVKAGTVTVAGTATVTARNVTPSHSSNQNGTSTQGYAIAAVGNSSYQQPATVSVASGATVTGTVIILKENGSETYGEITSAANTLTIPAGYVWNGPADGVYTLAVYVAPAVIDPTAGTPIEAADETAAQAAAQALDVGGMPEVSGLDQTAWNGYFTRYAEETAGGWVAKATLNPEAVFDATPTAEATDEQAILTAVLDSKATGATLQTAKPGLYYSLEGATSLGFALPVEGTRTLATSSEVTVTKPVISGNAVFFRVKVSVTAE